MPKIELHTLLDLVGGLNDSDQPGSASARFRTYLQENVQQASDLRDYIEDALDASGAQFNKALQDLINHLGQCLGFDVTYGRYRGVRGAIGFDGLWQSPTGWALVVEAKTTDVYTVKTSTLLGYINALVSEGQIQQPNNALGLYVYGRFDAHTSQLENAIKAEGRREKLRVASVDALLNLLELKQAYGLAHRTILNLLLPAPVRVDPLINLISDVVAQEKEESEIEPEMIESQFEPKIGERPPMTSLSLTSPPSNSRKATPLVPLDESYTGQSALAFTFDGERHEVHTWKEIADTLFEILWQRDSQKFETAVLALRGRKRPYFTRDQTDLRHPAQIINTDILFESNLSADYMVRLCYTVLDRMGYPTTALTIEAEA